MAGSVKKRPSKGGEGQEKAWQLAWEGRKETAPWDGEFLLNLPPAPGPAVFSRSIDHHVLQQMGSLQRQIEKLASELERSRHLEERRHRREHELERINSQERQRIGRELHDVVGQRLSALAFLLGAVESASETHSLADSDRRRNWQAIHDELAAVRRDLRMISTGLLPAGLGERGLAQALADLLARAENVGNLAGQLDWQVETTIGESQAEQLYWIAHEAVNNACKHARATRLDLALVETPGKLNMTIADNGVGLSLAAPQAGDGIGLRLISCRCQLLGGQLEIAPNQPTGTRLIVTIPLV